MTATPIKRRWSWKRWLDRIEASNLTESDRTYCRRLMELSRDSGKSRRAVQGWEIDFVDVAGVGSAMEKARRLGLVDRYRNYPIYMAIDEPAPKSGGIRVTSSQRALLARMLEGPGRVIRINRAGYVNRPHDSTKWGWYSDYLESKLKPSIPESLCRLGLIEPDGTGHGWPFQWTNFFHAPHWKLCQVSGLSRFAIDPNGEDKHWLKPDALKAVIRILRRENP